MRKDRETNALTVHSYDSALVFGPIFILIPTWNIVEQDWGGNVEKLLETRLADFTKDDFILPSGDAILCAQAVLAAANRLSPDDKLKMLKWDRRANTYSEVEIALPF